MEKTGRADGIVENDFTRAGVMLEPVVADWFAGTTNLEMVNPGNNVTKHATHDYILGTPDRIAIDAEKKSVGVVEIKTTGKSIDPANPPMTWFCQLAFYAGIIKSHGNPGYDTNYLTWFERVTCKFDFNEYPYDAAFIQFLFDKAGEFWINHVMKDIPPDPVNTIDLSTLYQRHLPGKVLIATQDTNEVLSALRDVKSQIKRLKNEQETLEFQIKSAMRDAESIIHPDGGTIATWKTPRDSGKFDEEKFRSEHPALYAQYWNIEPGSRRFLLK